MKHNYPKTKKIDGIKAGYVQKQKLHPDELHSESSQITKLNDNAKKNLSKENYEFYEDYSRQMIMDGIANNSQVSGKRLFLRLTDFIEGNWKDVNESDLKIVVAEIMTNYSSNGKETSYSRALKINLKGMVRFLHTGSRNLIKHKPELEMLQFITINKPEEKLTREDLPTDEEINKIIAVCADSTRDKAAIALQAEAGTRIGEVLALNIKDFVIQKNGAYIKVSGKTGTRSVLILKCVPYMVKWINDHPYKDNPEAPMFVYLSQSGTFGQRMTYAGFYTMFRKRIKQAGLKKRLYSHLFRHAEVTKLQGKLSEAESRMRHGWTKNSTMPSKYSHLNQSDLDSKILEEYGIKQKEPQKEELKECAFCKITYPIEIKYCEVCTRPLDINDVYDMEKEEEDKTTALFYELLRKEKSAKAKNQTNESRDKKIEEQQKEIDSLKEMIRKMSRAE